MRETAARLDALAGRTFADHPSLHDPGSAVSLGTLGAPVMLVCENASLTTAQRSGGDPWATSWGDLMLRRNLAGAGLDEGRFYLTDVVKSATTGAEWRALGSSGRWEHACWWAPVLAVELAVGPPKVLVTIGARARDLLDRLTSEGLVPAIATIRLHLPGWISPDSWPMQARDPADRRGSLREGRRQQALRRCS